ncbi:MAG: DUF1015 domain-containing protein [Firmicutes bacterium]|nr:DUF1015 domain-containing protein [Bacillota bacterium]
MAEIRPVRGLRYDPRAVGALRDVVSPPYDVVDAIDQERLCERSPFNIMRLLRWRPENGGGVNPYAEAAQEFMAWRHAGVLARDEKPTIYIYDQDSGKVRRGFTGLIRLSDYDSGIVLPHERTRPGPLEDRLNLMKAVHANLSSIFGLFDDPRGRVSQILANATGGRPCVEISDYDGMTHRLWACQDPVTIEALTRAMSDRYVVIADGHHRYEAALRYREWRARLEGRVAMPSIPGHRSGGDSADRDDPDHESTAHGLPGDRPYDYILMTFVPFDSEGTEILPTHRVVGGLVPETAENVERRMSGRFRKMGEYRDLGEVLDSMAAAQGEGKIAIGIYMGSGRFTVSELTSQSPAGSDAAVLDELVLGECLGIGPRDARRGEQVDFTHVPETAIREVDEGRRQLAFLLNPTPVTAVRDAALAGRIMPEKSTYFYPKLVAGLVINAF